MQSRATTRNEKSGGDFEGGEDTKVKVVAVSPQFSSLKSFFDNYEQKYAAAEQDAAVSPQCASLKSSLTKNKLSYLATVPDIRQEISTTRTRYIFHNAPITRKISQRRHHPHDTTSKVKICLSRKRLTKSENGMRKQNWWHTMERRDTGSVIGKKKAKSPRISSTESYILAASVYEDMRDMDRALEKVSNVIKMQESCLKQVHSVIGPTSNSLEILHDNQRKYEDAMVAFNRTFLIWKSAYGSDHPEIATSYINIGLMYRADGNLIRAVEYYNKVRAILVKFSGPVHPDKFNSIRFSWHARRMTSHEDADKGKMLPNIIEGVPDEFEVIL